MNFPKIVPISRFEVNDISMVPNFLPKERVLTFNWAKISPKDVIVFKNSQNFFIKRVFKVQKNNFFVSGDNKNRNLKKLLVQKSQIIGKVVAKY